MTRRVTQVGIEVDSATGGHVGLAAFAHFVENCPTVSYPAFGGGWEVWLLDTQGGLRVPLENFTSLEYVRAINGQYFHGYGYYTLIGPRTKNPVDEFTLDRSLVVFREGTGGLVAEFGGLHRNVKFWHDEQGTELFSSSGPDYKHLLKRRIIIPPQGEDFLTIDLPLTDTMRELVRECTVAGVTAEGREYTNWDVIAEQKQGVRQSLNYRYSTLYDELDMLSGLGVDWDVVRDGPDFRFESYLPYKGRDLRLNNECGFPPFVMSLDFTNIDEPSTELNRSDEFNVAYVGGVGVGKDRIIVERSGFYDAHLDSPYNRIETFVDASNDDNIASLMAQGDAHLVEYGSYLLFSCTIPEGEAQRYGTQWNLGDMCTGLYGGYEFDMRVVEVRVRIDFEAEQSVTISPTLLVYPGWQPTNA